MRHKPLDFNDVREMAMKLPDVEESSIHGAPSLRDVEERAPCDKRSQPHRLAGNGSSIILHCARFTNT
jgi:hypothetical protein